MQLRVRQGAAVLLSITLSFCATSSDPPPS